jgi:hypothetical protein
MGNEQRATDPSNPQSEQQDNLVIHQMLDSGPAKRWQGTTSPILFKIRNVWSI